MPTLDVRIWPASVFFPTARTFLRRSSKGSIPDLTGKFVQQRFHGHGDLVDAETAHGARVGIICIGSPCLDPSVGHLVGTTGKDDCLIEDPDGEGGIRTGICEQFCLHEEQLPFPVRSDFIIHLKGMFLCPYPQCLFPVQDDLHRHSQLERP